ncbi:hypothetical protein D6821_01315 [Candidatus Parcubacteria bacterium]|nr:MAG: hypothetical protein D6821_01315 [Candidatus Parcubacteria bacterium]
MYSRFLFQIIIIGLMVCFQVAFIAELPLGLANINLVLVVLVVLLILGKESTVWAWAIALGAVEDIYSFYPFGKHLIGMIAALLVARVLLHRFFTNRSLYAFIALGTVAVVCFFVFGYGWVAGIYFLAGKQFAAWRLLGERLIGGVLANALLMVVAFYILNYLSLNFKPVFLQPKQQL